MNRAQMREWDHTSVTVADLGTAVDFFQAAFGYRVVLENSGLAELIAGLIGVPGADADLVQLRSPQSHHTLELIQLRDAGSQDCSAPVAVGSGHLAFRVVDFDDAVRVVGVLGARTIGEVVEFPNGRRVVYLRAPGGCAFELSEYRGSLSVVESAS